MASMSYMCSLCKEDLLDNLAVVWCPECDDFLCADCERHHKKIKASKHHRTTTIELYSKLPENVQNVSYICSDHNQKLEMYCPKHACACCFQCFTLKHSSCGNIKQLTEVVKNIKSSVRVTQLETELGYLKSDYNTVLKHMRASLEASKKDKSKGLSKIKCMRGNVNKFMNAIEKNLTQNLSSEHDIIRREISTTIANAESRRQLIDHSQSNLKAVVENGTELQIYHCLTDLEKIREDGQSDLKELKKSSELNIRKVEVNLCDSFPVFFKKIENFGSIVKSTTPPNISFATGSKSVVQFAETKPMDDIDCIRPLSMISFKIPSNITKTHEITGCSVLDNNDLLLLDTDNKMLYRFTAEGKFQNVVYVFGDRPSSICVVKENILAVTIHDSNTLLMINLSNSEKTFERTFPGPCFGVDSDHSIIAVTCTNYGRVKTEVYLLNTDGEILNSFDIDSPYSGRVAVNHGKIFLSSFRKNKVMCHHQNGNVIWECRNKDLVTPSSLAVDRHGFVFVACQNNNSIVVLSPNGSKGRVLLSKKDGILDPIALSINHRNGRICVANRGDGRIYCFSISKGNLNSP